MPRPSRSPAISLLVLLLLGLASTPALSESPAAAWNLTVFHTNDVHSAFFVRPAPWRDDGRPVGGAVPLAHHLAAERAQAAPDIFVDAGDFMTGNPVCRLVDDGVTGAPVARIMTALGYDAGVVGNHEFDLGYGDLGALAPLFGYPLLAADIRDEAGEPVFRAAPLLLARGELKVGIIGVSCAGMARVVTAERFGPHVMQEQAALVRAQAAAIDAETDVIVVISHNGVGGDKALARQLAGAGVDVIVGGHSHTRLKEPEVEAGIIIVQAGSRLTNLGRLDLRVEDDRVVAHEGRLIDLWAEGATADPALVALVDGYAARVDEEFGRELGTLASDLRKGRGESALGNFLADAIRLRAGADVGLINSGGIRKNLAAGPVTALDVHEVLPFDNTVVTVTMSGAQLADVVQTNAEAQAGRTHGILQVSGLAYTFAGAAPVTVREITVAGKPLDPQAAYTVAMPDYVVQMANVYLGEGLEPAALAMRGEGVLLSEAVADEIVRRGTVNADIEGRIIRIQ